MPTDHREENPPPLPLPMSVVFEVTLNSTQWRKAFWMSQEERLWGGFVLVVFVSVVVGNVLKLLDVSNAMILAVVGVILLVVAWRVWCGLEKAYQKLQGFWDVNELDREAREAREARHQIAKALGGDVAHGSSHRRFKEFFFEGASGDDHRRYVAQWQFKEEGLMCRPQGEAYSSHGVIPWPQFKYFRLEKTDIYILCEKSNMAYFLPVNQAPQGTLDYLDALCRHYLIRYVETTRVKGSTRNFYRN